MSRIDRIVFFGTPEFAVPSLDALVAAGRRPVLVVTQPARPAGRGRRLVEPPVAGRARELGLPVRQPTRVRNQEFLDEIGSLAPDLAAVVAFGQIFPQALLDLPRHGCLNVHASLLPRWRGAAPIAAAIAAGDAETGVSVQRMDAGLDTGPVLTERRTAIGADENAGDLAERLAPLGAELLVEVIAALERGDAEAAPQSESGVTLAPKLGAPHALDLGRPAVEVARAVRAFNPEPGVVLVRGGERLKVLRAAPSDATGSGAPGTILAVAAQSLIVAAGEDTALELTRVQRPGGRPLSGRELANGLRLRAGDSLL